jgi:23S rRNA pseudouridine1911/1915/1917 synthase
VEETEELLVVDKAAGVLIHPTKPGGPRTLWDDARDLLAYEIANGGQVSIINRLDRETSGLVLLAKTASAAREAAMAMAAGKVRKEYLALVFGWPDWETLDVDAPLLRLGEVAESRIWLKRGVHAAGVEARTGFEVVERAEWSGGRRVALVRARPLTGRTHQIRVHLAHVGFPVVGDKIYGPDEGWYLRFIENGWTEEMAAALWLPRHALHSAALGVEWRGEWREWRSGGRFAP